ncbi:hypothetical protein GCM10023144_47780 [Pigmentiphaga soli]|uniref:Uncharacterized protein n=1 Tax=Pigmentiphaga soli TaxID=1007095 RepID=A0ABP8HTK1_9BURK
MGGLLRSLGWTREDCFRMARRCAFLAAFSCLFLWGLVKVGAVCPALLDIMALRLL